MLGLFNTFLIIVYFLFVLFIGFSSRKKGGDESFLIANRNVGVFALTATLVASLFGGNSIVTFMTFIFEYGPSILWAQIGLACGCFLLVFLSPKIKGLSDKHKFHTFGDYYFHHFGKVAGIFSSLITFLVYVGFVLIQFIAGGIVLSSITGWSYELSVFIMGVVVSLYLFVAGFNAVVRTDVFQYILIFFLVIVSFFMFSKIEVFTLQNINIFSGSFFDSASFFLYGLMMILLGADLWQRIYAGNSISTVKKSLSYTGFIFIFLSILLFLIGITVKNNFPGIVPETALVVGFTSLLPSYLLGIALVVLFAAIMSTLDSFIFLLSSSVSKDFFHKLFPNKKINLSSYTKNFSLVIGLFSMFLAFFLSSIIDVFISIVGVYFAIFPSLIFSFWFKLKKESVVLSMFFGSIVPIILFIFVGISIETAISSLPSALIALGIGQLFFKNY